MPREDADLSYFSRSETTTTCPFKGEANYFNLVANGDSAGDAVWTYESPLPGVAEIKDHLAFYPDQVELIEDPAG